jgi:hypothetical protein
MDFEWQGYGPVDATSPFHKYAMESSKKRKSTGIPCSNKAAITDQMAGTHSQFDSPAKPSLPSLDEPNGKPWFFSNAPVSPTEQPSPFRAPSFTTPRKPFDIDFSSPADSSPAEQADNEETPDAKPYEFTSTSAKPATKRNSLFGMYGRFAPSPGRKPYNDALERRIHKRRRRAQNFDSQTALVRRASDDTSSDEADQLTQTTDKRTLSNPQRYQCQEQDQPQSWLRSCFTFITSFPDAPVIIANYLQIFFNFAIFSSVLYMLYSFYKTIQADVDRTSDEAMAEVLSEMAQCSRNYIENQCGADARLPALEAICSNWELCMNRDPAAVKRAKLSAYTFAEIVNSFFEPISLKTMAFASILVILSIAVNNVTFTLFRRQYESHHQNPNTFNPQYQLHPSGQYTVPMTPGVAFPSQVTWHDNFQGNDRRIEYSMSPTKLKDRGRSRSPEKR